MRCVAVLQDQAHRRALTSHPFEHPSQKFESGEAISQTPIRHGKMPGKQVLWFEIDHIRPNIRPSSSSAETAGTKTVAGLDEGVSAERRTFTNFFFHVVTQMKLS